MDDCQRRKAPEAEIEALERRVVTIPAKDWERFESWATRRARAIAGLEELFSMTPTWRK